MKKVYLASPYSGKPSQELERFMEVCCIAGDLIKSGCCVFSPIAHSHYIAVLGGIPGDHSFWQTQNEKWLEWCDEVYVAKIGGWKESRGVQWEIEWANRNGKRVKFVK